MYASFRAHDVDGGIAVVGAYHLLERIHHGMHMGRIHDAVAAVDFGVPHRIGSLIGATHAAAHIRMCAHDRHFDLACFQVGRRHGHRQLKERRHCVPGHAEIVLLNVDDARFALGVLT